MTERLPLLQGHTREDAIVRRADGPVSLTRFLGAATALASDLPPRRYVVNLCEDRYAFMLGLAASLLARQTTLLPPSHAPQAVRESCADCAGDVYCLVDDGGIPQGMLRKDLRDLRFGVHAADSIPALEASHPAAIVFTSGSTGRPTPHLKTWGSLVAGARALAERVRTVVRSTVIGTIPPQHMFGLEATIMLPWQNGMSVYARRPFLPADLREALERLPAPCWLMTSPLHVRAFVDAGLELRGLAGAISSTMPLDADLAGAAERLWNAPIYEIYGSSEAGMIATRRTARERDWALCPGVRLRRDRGQTWVEGGHIASAQRIADELTPVDDAHFVLHGRSAEILKVAGKRTTLAALELALRRVRGVRDGAFFLPAGGRDARPAAFVVAPGRSAREILAELREHVDHAFLPRPLFVVPSLPRAASGKLPRQALADLAAALHGSKVAEDDPA